MATLRLAWTVLTWIGFVLIVTFAVLDWRAVRTRVRMGEAPDRRRAILFTVFAVFIIITETLDIVSALTD